jgi:GDPmannose 4,6-dehydratase
MGNMDALRDWGHAKDYVEMQWLMLQQDKPDDFVIATGIQYSVRQFIEMAAAELDFKIEWQGKGVDETGRVAKISGDKTPGLKVGDVIVRIDPRYFRPTEVETLLGDPSKAKAKLGWVPKITLNEMIIEMVTHDLDQARRHALLKSSGFKISVSCE